MEQLNERSKSLCGLLLVLIFAARVVGKDNTSAAEIDGFVTLKQSDGRGFRAFVAGPADALIWALESGRPVVQSTADDFSGTKTRGTFYFVEIKEN
jgi:hypothetical protein